MTESTAAQRASKQADKDAIRPFQANFPETELAELRRRINATKWPERETVTDATQGVQLATMKNLARYWGTDYDWRKCEAKLNALPQFITEIDGLDIHFIHVRSKHENALPLIVTHGWPGSIIERLTFVYSKGIAYGYQMGLRPQTLYGIADSPVGLAAYFLDHDAWSYSLISRVFSGEAAGLTRDDVLDNITITWLTNTAISGARLYWENKLPFFSVKGVSIPVAVSAFPDEIDLCPRSWAERAYPKLIHYNKLDKGGHFAAWEQPQLLSEEVRAGFRSLR